MGKLSLLCSWALIDDVQCFSFRHFKHWESAFVCIILAHSGEEFISRRPNKIFERNYPTILPDYQSKLILSLCFFNFFLFYSTILSRYNLNSIPFSILFQYTVTYLSLSRRDCSWKKPSACINSCIAVPFRSQPFPKDNRCLPPLRPIEDQQLWVNKQIMSNSDWRKLWAEGSISWGLLVPISYYPTTANLF